VEGEQTYGRQNSIFELSARVVPRVAWFSVFVGLSNGVHSGGTGHATVHLDAVHDMTALLSGDDEPLEVLGLGLIQSLAHRRGRRRRCHEGLGRNHGEIRSRRRCICLTVDDRQEERIGLTGRRTMVLALCFYGYLHDLRRFVMLGWSPRESRYERTNASETRREEGGTGLHLDDVRDL
jgi:hypothetical protein